MLVAALLLSSVQPANPDWVEYHRERRGWSETPDSYDARSVERRSGRVLVWTRYSIALSGLPDPQFYTRYEIDCRRGAVRQIAHRVERGMGQGERLRVGRTNFSPIAADTPFGRLAGRLCATGDGPGLN